MLPAIDAFKARFVAQDSFCAYFDKEWLPKYEMWVAAYRAEGVPTTTGALESYHGVIKMLFLSSR